MPFVIYSISPTDSNPYLSPQLDGNKELLLSSKAIHKNPKGLPKPNKSKLFYHVNRLTNVYRLCISLFVTPDILVITYGKGHLRFFCYYKIILYFYFIYSLTKLFYVFICYCSQCLALQTRQYHPYKLLQLIKLPPVPFFIPTLDFMLVFSLLKEKFNAIMSVMYEFSQQVILLEGANTWLAE